MAKMQLIHPSIHTFFYSVYKYLLSKYNVSHIFEALKITKARVLTQSLLSWDLVRGDIVHKLMNRQTRYFQILIKDYKKQNRIL